MPPPYCRTVVLYYFIPHFCTFVKPLALWRAVYGTQGTTYVLISLIFAYFVLFCPKMPYFLCCFVLPVRGMISLRGLAVRVFCCLILAYLKRIDSAEFL